MAPTEMDEQDILAEMAVAKARCQRHPHPCQVIGELVDQLAEAMVRIDHLEDVLHRASRCISLQLQLIEQRAHGDALKKLPIVRSLEVHQQTFDQVLATSARHGRRLGGHCHA